MSTLSDAFAAYAFVAIAALLILKSIGWVFWKVIPAHRARLDQERQKLRETLSEARRLPLKEAAWKLYLLGLKYDGGFGCSHAFTFPRHFWEWGDVELKAAALLTVVNHHQATCGFGPEQMGYYRCQQDLASVIFRRARKIPDIAVTLACAIARSGNRAKKVFEYLP